MDHEADPMKELKDNVEIYQSYVLQTERDIERLSADLEDAKRCTYRSHEVPGIASSLKNLREYIEVSRYDLEIAEKYLADALKRRPQKTLDS
jgi:hypothetical protein